MNPDAILKGLRRELESLDKKAENFAERAKAIEAEIEANLKLERPTVAEDQTTTVDNDAVYLAGLKNELDRAPERKREIEIEIARVEKLIGRAEPKAEGSEKPAAKPSRARAEDKSDAVAE